MKKFLLSLASLALLACVFATAAFANDVTYAVSDVNLRQGPGMEYGVVTVIPSGAAVYMEVPDTGSGWTVVDYGDLSGYVATRYLLIGQNSNPAAAGTRAFTPGNYTTTAGVNLRTGPGTNYAVQIVVPAGASLYVDSVTNGWAHTGFANYDGYVSSEYLAGLGGSSPTVTSNTAPSGNANNGSYTITGNVNLRTGPGTEYGSMMVIPAGAAVSVSDYSNGWAHVNYADYVGYVSTKYVSGLGGSATYTAPAATAPDGRPAPAASGTTWYQGHNYAPVYNYTYYYIHHKDVVDALGASPEALIKHFVDFGMSEGRQGCEFFNVYSYRDANPDLQKLYGDDLRLYYLHACGLA